MSESYKPLTSTYEMQPTLEEKDAAARDLLAALPALEQAMAEKASNERERKRLDQVNTLSYSEPAALRRNPWYARALMDMPNQSGNELGQIGVVAALFCSFAVDKVGDSDPVIAGSALVAFYLSLASTLSAALLYVVFAGVSGDVVVAAMRDHGMLLWTPLSTFFGSVLALLVSQLRVIQNTQSLAFLVAAAAFTLFIVVLTWKILAAMSAIDRAAQGEVLKQKFSEAKLKNAGTEARLYLAKREGKEDAVEEAVGPKREAWYRISDAEAIAQWRAEKDDLAVTVDLGNRA
jgi:hypothetical protein